MKKLITTFSLLAAVFSMAQVAVGKTSVSSNSVSLEFGTANRGLVLPWVDSASSVSGAVDGTFIFDTSDKKVKYRSNGSWTDLSVDTTGTADTSLQSSRPEQSTAKVAIGSTAATDTTPGILVLTDTNKAMVLPKVADPYLNIINPAAGMMVYDTNKKQLAVFNGTVWSFWTSP